MKEHIRQIKGKMKLTPEGLIPEPPEVFVTLEKDNGELINAKRAYLRPIYKRVGEEVV